MKAIQGLNVYRLEFWTVSYAVMCIITILGETTRYCRLVSPAATGSRPPLNCAATSGAPVTAWVRAPPHQCWCKQGVGILLGWLIVNRLDNRGYYSRTTFWRGECRYIECSITLTSLLESYNFQKRFGSKSTPKFAIGSTVDSRELVDTERLQRGLLFSMKDICAQSTWM